MHIDFKPKVLIRMRVYNDPKNVRVAIESILNQTERRFIFLLNDNGSTDQTKDICEEYARKDKRIIVFRNEKNNDWSENEGQIFYDLLTDIVHHGVEYFAFLDSDDIYNEKFIEKTLVTAEETQAEIVICGNGYMSEQGNLLSHTRIPPELVFENKQLSAAEFIDIYRYFRCLWGKLYRINLIWEYERLVAENHSRLGSSLDTFLVLELLKNIHKVACIPDNLHLYRYKEHSLYRGQIKEERIEEGSILLEQAISYTAVCGLNHKDEVKQFLYSIFFYHIKDALDLVLGSTSMSIEAKATFIDKLMCNKDYYFICDISSNECKDAPSYLKYLSDMIKILCDMANKRQLADLHLNYYWIQYNRYIEGDFDSSLLAGVFCREQNKLGWGQFGFSGYLKQNKEEIIDYVNRNKETYSETLLMEKKQEIMYYINSQKYKEAIPGIKELVEIYPLDRDVLYFKACLEYVSGEEIKAVDTIITSKVFYLDDDMENLLQLIYESI